MKKIVPIGDFQVNSEVQGFFLCREKQLRTSRSGEAYLDLVLSDKTGEVAAKVWDRATELAKGFDVGDALAVRGRVESFQDRQQLVVGRIQRATAEKYGRFGFRADDLVPVSPLDPDKMWADVSAAIEGIGDPPLRNLLATLFRHNKKALMRIPASISYHYPYRAGYLEHIHSMLKISPGITGSYGADADLVTAGVCLHGIGKVKEYTDELVPRVTDAGHFLGHIELGREMVRQGAAESKGISEERLLILEHLILSHEGWREGDPLSRAKMPEALVVQIVDHLDCRMFLFRQTLAGDTEPGSWTARRNPLGTQLFKGKSPESR